MAQLDGKHQMVLAHPSIEMDSLHGRGDSFEQQSLVNPTAGPRKMHNIETSSTGSFSTVPRRCTIRQMKNKVYDSTQIVIWQSKLNVLLLFGPIAVLVHHLTQHHGWVFFFSFLGIIPLAERLGYATEQLAFFTGPTVGGLLNATFGNAIEMIISIYALQHGMMRVVQQSLLGSILSNMLLVLGAAFFCGGIVHNKKDQIFNKATALVNSGLLLMAVMSLLFPAVLHYTHTEMQYGKSEMALSRFSSCVMLVAYACNLFFQLKSHSNLSVDEGGSESGGGSDEDEDPEITVVEALIWLGIFTLWVSFLSGYLVDAIEEMLQNILVLLCSP